MKDLSGKLVPLKPGEPPGIGEKYTFAIAVESADIVMSRDEGGIVIAMEFGVGGTPNSTALPTGRMARTKESRDMTFNCRGVSVALTALHHFETDCTCTPSFFNLD